MKKSLLLFALPFGWASVLHAQEADTSKMVSVCIGCYLPVTLIEQRPLIAEYPEYNFSKTIEGKAPGVQTTNGGGQPGSSADIAIRGLSGINESNAPLIILDGIPYYGDYNAINTDDIKSITILKDAQATFEFGNKARNGIITVVTGNRLKKGQKKTLEVNAQFGTSTQALQGYKTLDTKTYLETLNGVLQRTNQPYDLVNFLGGYNPYNVPSDQLIGSDGTLNPNARLRYQDSWKSEMTRIGIRQNYNVAASANSDRGAYYLSLGYVNDKGFVHQTDYERFSARFNGDLNITPWLKLGLRSQTAIDDQDYASTSYDNANVFLQSQLMAPVYPVYYRNANDEKEIDPATGKNKFDWGNTAAYPNSSIGNRRYAPGFNSIGSLYSDKNTRKMNMFLLNPYVSAMFAKHFTYSADFNYNYNQTNYLQQPSNIYGQFATYNAKGTNRNKIDVLNFRQKLTWENNWGNHHLKWILGNDYYKENTAIADSFNTNSWTSNYQTVSTSFHSLGCYTQATYDYKSKYFITGGYRKDQTLNTDYKWENNWMMGVVYDITQERFFKDVYWVNELKLKANYGTQGQNALNRTSYTGATMITTTNVLTNNQVSGGIEATLLDGKFSFEANVYSRNSVGLVNIPYPPSTLISDVFDQEKYNNKGIELSLYTINISHRNFRWLSKLMVTHNTNKITAVPESLGTSIMGDHIYENGKSIATYYLPEYAGVNPDNGYALYYTTDINGNRTTTTDASQAYQGYKDAGSAFPKVYGSLTNNFTWPHFEVSFQLNYSLGGKYYDRIYQSLMGSAAYATNWSTDVLKQWTPNHTNTDVPAISPYGYNPPASTQFLKSASYLNVANLYAGYTFNGNRIKKLKMQSLRIYLSANNLWMITGRRGMNPQADFYNNPGYVYGPARTIVFGLKVGI